MQHILNFILLLSLSINTSAQSVDEESHVTETQQVLDAKNIENIRKIADSQRKFQYFGGYPGVPENIEKIAFGGLQQLCRTISGWSPGDVLYDNAMERIKKYYKEGDTAHFFQKYLLPMNCSYPSISLGDFFMNDADKFNWMFMTYLKYEREYVDFNMFIRIKAEGKTFEGPMHVVFAHLRDNWPNSPKYRSHYLSMDRKKKDKRFLKPGFVFKDCKQMQRENPGMPCTLPMP